MILDESIVLNLKKLPMRLHYVIMRSSLCDENTDSSETDSVDSPSLPPLPSPSSSEEELIDYQTPDIPLDNVYLYEPFDDKDSFHKNWVTSKATKSDSEDGKYDGEWEIVPTVERIPVDSTVTNVV
uniref:Uncharacterized protein n=1 Tax=Tetranychus urticae TaxID=32264 RepID=T1L645_TETUR